MNPLEEYPHLFANGKFKAVFHSASGNWHGTINSYDADFMQLKVSNTWAEDNELTLIARPIEDMTDEECTGSVLFECLRDKAEPKYIRKELIEMNYLRRTMRLSLYLLSIGVYPFDQSHFDDGTVIDSRTLKQANN